jgi:hypothetical protein
MTALSFWYLRAHFFCPASLADLTQPGLSGLSCLKRFSPFF